jgi:hypothetical protein
MLLTLKHGSDRFSMLKAMQCGLRARLITVTLVSSFIRLSEFDPRSAKGWSLREGNILDNDLIDIEVMVDREGLAALSAVICSEGQLLVCHRCRDVDAIIAGIVVMREVEQAWVLCGPCLREIPVQGCLAS